MSCTAVLNTFFIDADPDSQATSYLLSTFCYVRLQSYIEYKCWGLYVMVFSSSKQRLSKKPICIVLVAGIAPN